VLDIDVDFFVEPTVYDAEGDDERPDPAEHTVWPAHPNGRRPRRQPTNGVDNVASDLIVAHVLDILILVIPIQSAPPIGFPA
jgi:hypothetical protein